MQKVINLKVKAYSLGELARIYGVDWRTLKKWLQPFSSEIGAKTGRYYSIKQVEIIFDRLGYPYVLLETA